MKFYNDAEIYESDDDDDDDYDDYEDDADDDDDDDDDIAVESGDEDEDVFETLEYNDTCQIQTRKEIIDDIKMYLRKYQPLYKVVRKKDL